MQEASSDPTELHWQANDSQRNDVLPAQLAYCRSNSARRQKLEQCCDRNGDAEQHHRINPSELAARPGKDEVRYEKEPGNQYPDCTIREMSSQHSRCTEPEKPVRGEQQREGRETASHVALDADLQVEMASHQPERHQQQ